MTDDGVFEVCNLSHICKAYTEMSSPIAPAATVEEEIDIFLAITNGPGKENYVYPKGIFAVQIYDAFHSKIRILSDQK